MDSRQRQFWLDELRDQKDRENKTNKVEMDKIKAQRRTARRR